MAEDKNQNDEEKLHIDLDQLDLGEVEEVAEQEDLNLDEINLGEETDKVEEKKDLGLGEIDLGEDSEKSESTEEDLNLDEIDLGEDSEKPESTEEDLDLDEIDLGEDSEKEEAPTEDLNLDEIDLGEDSEKPEESTEDLNLDEIDLGESSEKEEAPTEDLNLDEIDLGESSEKSESTEEDLDLDEIDLGEDSEKSEGSTEDLNLDEIDLGEDSEKPESTEEDLDLDEIDLGEDSEKSESTEEDLNLDEIDLGEDSEKPESTEEDLDLDEIDLGEDSEKPESTEEDLNLDEIDLGEDSEKSESTEEDLNLDEIDLGEDSEKSESTEEDLNLDEIDLGEDSEKSESTEEDLNLDEIDLGEDSEKPEATEEDLNLDEIDLGEDSEKPEATEEDLNLDELDLEETAEEELDLNNIDKKEESFSSLNTSDVNDKKVEDKESLEEIKSNLSLYPYHLINLITNCIENNKLNDTQKNELIELIKQRSSPEDISNFIGEATNDPKLKSQIYTEDGIPFIILNKIYTPEGLERQKKLVKRTLISCIAIPIILLTSVLSYKYIIEPFRADYYYDKGLEDLYQIQRGLKEEKQEFIQNAEKNFKKGELIEPNHIEYLNKYGMAYLKINEENLAFEKLFGKLQPAIGESKIEKSKNISWKTKKTIPIFSFVQGSNWDTDKLPVFQDEEKYYMYVFSQDKINRKVLKAGAYLVSSLRDNQIDEMTYLNLGKFHSKNRKDNLYETKDKYKNNNLAIDYFDRILKEDISNIKANLGLGDLYYNNQQYSNAIDYYKKLIEIYPNSPVGYNGLIASYIKIWEKNKNPQLVLRTHRVVKNSLDIEEELSIYTLVKLAAFYIELDPKNILAKYNINPEDQISGLNIKDTIKNLFSVALSKKEVKDDGKVVSGDSFAELYYQRGRFLLKEKEMLQALKQFENAVYYDPSYYLAVIKMADYYMKINNLQESMKLLDEAEKRYNYYFSTYGSRREDEILLENNLGEVYFKKGKIMYLEAVGIDSDEDISAFPGNKIYPERSIAYLLPEDKTRRNQLMIANNYFKKASEFPLKENFKTEMDYYRGWIEYNYSNFTEALKNWAQFDELTALNNKEILMAKGNVYFYLNNYEISLGNYLRAKEELEEKAFKIIAKNNIDRPIERQILATLAAVYNNIGAIYEKKNEQEKALKYYWNAIEMGRRTSSVSEIASTNKDLLFKREGLNSEPLLEDWLPPLINN